MVLQIPYIYLFMSKPAKECSVVPDRWHAATPVLAVTIVASGGKAPTTFFNRKLLPVPALPIVKRIYKYFHIF